MRIQYILHADFESPGIIQSWAKQNRFSEKLCRPFAGETLPSPDCFDLLIVMGGPQSPLEVENAPYLIDEIALIKKALHLKMPVLGFCLGAQLIGEALGATTERSPHKEVGVFPIELTEEGTKDPLLDSLPSKFSVVHWHNDMPGLTKDAKILAFSRGCPRQIVRYQSLVYGFQCHPEPTKENVETMIQCCPEDLAPQRFVQPVSEFLAHDFNAINRIMIQILNNLLKVRKLYAVKTL
jgi:GMP synthase (glutamine-hydrolysing)